MARKKVSPKTVKTTLNLPPEAAKRLGLASVELNKTKAEIVSELINREYHRWFISKPVVGRAGGPPADSLEPLAPTG